jgi:hypothetical protein
MATRVPGNVDIVPRGQAGAHLLLLLEMWGDVGRGANLCGDGVRVGLLIGLVRIDHGGWRVDLCGNRVGRACG